MYLVKLRQPLLLQVQHEIIDILEKSSKGLKSIYIYMYRLLCVCVYIYIYITIYFIPLIIYVSDCNDCHFINCLIIKSPWKWDPINISLHFLILAAWPVCVTQLLPCESGLLLIISGHPITKLALSKNVRTSFVRPLIGFFNGGPPTSFHTSQLGLSISISCLYYNFRWFVYLFFSFS